MDVVEFLGDFKFNNFFNEEVFVYMFKGDMCILLKGVIVFDFVFGIYFDVGYYCQVVWVNNCIVFMGYELCNGD